jgi:hypothetical protein
MKSDGRRPPYLTVGNDPVGLGKRSRPVIFHFLAIFSIFKGFSEKSFSAGIGPEHVLKLRSAVPMGRG